MNTLRITITPLDNDLMDISSHLSVLTSDVFQDLIRMLTQIQTHSETHIPVQIPESSTKKFCCYKKSVNQDLKDETCSICLEKYKNKSIVVKPNDCNHLFHVKCLEQWFNHKSTCPVCRKPCLFSNDG